MFISNKTKSSYCTKNHVMRKQIFCQNILLTHSCNSVCDSQLNHSTTSSKVFFFVILVLLGKSHLLLGGVRVPVTFSCGRQKF